MISVGLLGYQGRMGRLIAQEIAESNLCRLAGGLIHSSERVAEQGNIFLTTDVAEVISRSDVVIDFTTAEVTSSYALIAASLKKPFLSGTTGLSHESLETLKTIALDIPILYATNTSLSLSIFKSITRLAAQLFAPFDYDIVITDEHHRFKKDAPSGTAKTIGEAIREGNTGSKIPSFHSIRAGYIVGEHEVTFAGNNETVSLHHSVTDRSVFARGALHAALWLAQQKPGLYSMDDVLNPLLSKSSD